MMDFPTITKGSTVFHRHRWSSLRRCEHLAGLVGMKWQRFEQNRFGSGGHIVIVGTGLIRTMR